ISDVSFFEFKRMLAYKSAYRGNEVIEADRFYPSSKTCHCCGYKKEFLTLSERIFQCENCGITIDRDYNASLNLKRYAINNIGLVQAEFTPEDLTALQSDLAINRIATSKVDTGIQQKSCL
ncbi:transposase, partial [Campylobacter coli]|nr:transposase [Campylobacter coli]